MQPDDGAIARRHPVLRYLLFVSGWLSIALGVAGIFLPILPTTPFLLLAAACFARSSPRFYHWLVSHPRLGPWIVDFLDGKGMPKKAKVYAIALLWIGIGTSVWIVQLVWVQALLVICALLVSAYLLRLPTRHVQ